MQKRVLAVYFSMMRRRAIWAVAVMASASSRMMSLNVASDESPALGAAAKICFVLLNVLICSRTTSIPLSSDALSSKTICRMFLFPYMRRASARTVDVFPVPGGP